MSTPAVPVCKSCSQEFNHGRRSPMVGYCGHSVCAKCRPRLARGRCPFCNYPASFKLPKQNFLLLELIEQKEEEEDEAEEEAISSTSEEVDSEDDEEEGLLGRDLERARASQLSRELDRRVQEITRLRRELAAYQIPTPQSHVVRPRLQTFMVPSPASSMTRTVLLPTHSAAVARLRQGMQNRRQSPSQFAQPMPPQTYAAPPPTFVTPLVPHTSQTFMVSAMYHPIQNNQPSFVQQQPQQPPFGYTQWM